MENKREIIFYKHYFPEFYAAFFYHGKAKWNYETLSDYFKNIQPNFQPFIPKFDFILINVASYSDEDIESFNSNLLEVSLLLMKYINKPRTLKTKIKYIFSRLKTHFEEELVNEFFEASVRYLYFNTKSKIKNILEPLTEISIKIGGNAMTIAERLIHTGKKEGVINAQTNVVKNGIKKGIEIKILADLTGLSIKKIKEIIKDIN